jgi:hypothetical protein
VNDFMVHLQGASESSGSARPFRTIQSELAFEKRNYPQPLGRLQPMFEFVRTRQRLVICRQSANPAHPSKCRCNRARRACHSAVAHRPRNRRHQRPWCAFPATTTCERANEIVAALDAPCANASMNRVGESFCTAHLLIAPSGVREVGDAGTYKYTADPSTDFVHDVCRR